MPEFANSVIPCGINGEFVFVILSYIPKSSMSPQPFANPEIFVEPARSADIATNKGLPYFLRLCELIQEATLEKPTRFGIFVPGSAKISSG